MIESETLGQLTLMRVTLSVTVMLSLTLGSITLVTVIDSVAVTESLTLGFVSGASVADSVAVIESETLGVWAPEAALYVAIAAGPTSEVLSPRPPE